MYEKEIKENIEYDAEFIDDVLHFEKINPSRFESFDILKATFPQGDKVYNMKQDELLKIYSPI